MPTYDFSAQATEAAGAGTALVDAATSAFQSMWPVAVGLIALVFLGFWVINRTKKAANGAR